MADRVCFSPRSSIALSFAILASLLGIAREARATTPVAEAGVVALPTPIDASQWTSIRVHGEGNEVVWIVAAPGGSCSDLAAATWHDASDAGADRPDAEVLEGARPGLDPSQADAIAVEEDEDTLEQTLTDWAVDVPDELAARLDEAAEKGDCFVALRSGDAPRVVNRAPARPMAPLAGSAPPSAAPSADAVGPTPAPRIESTPDGPGQAQDDNDGGSGGGGGGAAAAEACGSAAGSAGDSCGSGDDSGDDCSGSSDEGDDCSGSGGGGEDCSGGAPDDCRLAHDGTRGHRARRSPTSRLVLALAGIAFFARRRKTTGGPR
ncbi:MAG TPA: hypothetical protein VIY73_01220 [Polyangiaceae bacterium]